MSQSWETLSAQIAVASQRKLAAAVSAVDEIAENVLAESKELCPVSPTNEFLMDGGKTLKRATARKDRVTGKPSKKIRNPLYTGTSGSLRDSGHATKATLEAGRIAAQVGYNTEYAAAVHERTAVKHGAALKAANPGANIPNLKGQAKFLAIPMVRNRKGFGPYVAGRMARA